MVTMMLTTILWIQATWLLKLYEAQEKYQELVKSRYREGVEASATGATYHGVTIDVLPDPVVPAHGDWRAGDPAGRGWLDAAAKNSSLIVPSFAVYDYGELVRAFDTTPVLSLLCCNNHSSLRTKRRWSGADLASAILTSLLWLSTLVTLERKTIIFLRMLYLFIFICCPFSTLCKRLSPNSSTWCVYAIIRFLALFSVPENKWGAKTQFSPLFCKSQIWECFIN